MAKMLTSETFDKEVTESSLPVLVDVYADWCGPCKARSPVVEQLAAEYEGKVKVCKINVDDSQDIAARFGVMSIPTFIFFKDGKAAGKMVGMQDTFGRSAENYQLLLEKYHLMPEDVAAAVKAVLEA